MESDLAVVYWFTGTVDAWDPVLEGLLWRRGGRTSPKIAQC